MVVIPIVMSMQIIQPEATGATVTRLPGGEGSAPTALTGLRYIAVSTELYVRNLLTQSYLIVSIVEFW